MSLFLTRETTYAQLLMSVSENEAKIDKLRKDNENWREKLQELQMLRKENAQLRSAAAVAEQEIYRSLQVDGFVPCYAHRHAYPI